MDGSISEMSHHDKHLRRFFESEDKLNWNKKLLDTLNSNNVEIRAEVQRKFRLLERVRFRASLGSFRPNNVIEYSTTQLLQLLANTLFPQVKNRLFLLFQSGRRAQKNAQLKKNKKKVC